MIHYKATQYLFEMIDGKGNDKFGQLDTALLRFAILVSHTKKPD